MLIISAKPRKSRFGIVLPTVDKVVQAIATRDDYEHLRRATVDGTLMRIRQGVYAETSALANNMIDVQRIVPNGVLCLYSAFAHYGLSTHVPAATCIAIDAKRKVRLPEYPPIDLYYWKKENLEFGIVQKEISGYMVLITDMERSVCDAVKYRNKIGLDDTCTNACCFAFQQALKKSLLVEWKLSAVCIGWF